MLAAYRAWHAGYLLPHLFAAARQPAELEPPSLGRRDREPANPHPDRSCDHACDITDAAHDYGCMWTVAGLARPDAHPASPTVLLPAVLDADPGNQPVAAMHEGAQDDDATTQFFAGLRADDTASLDPVEAAWEHAFRTLGATIDAEAQRVRRVMDAALERLAPGWVQAICERTGCGLCVHDFGEAMEAAGVIVLPARPVDWATAEWAVVPG
jgi:hypothetical protein